jgi:hypothetical protein
MTFKVVLPLYLSWRDLKMKVGWPYSRAHTSRLSDPAKTPDPFPPAGKIGHHRNSHPMWYAPDVLAYFKRHGLPVPESLEFSQ